jgi:hypothetical protein
VTGSIGCETFTVSSGGVVLALILATIEVPTAAGAGAEVAMMGALAVAAGAGTVVFLGLAYMIAPCGQMVCLC